MKPEERLICALDFENAIRAKEMVNCLDGLVSFFKVGIVLFTISGTELVNWIISKGKKVFLDLKFFDVPETVEKAVRQAARLGISLLTVHGNAKIIKSAVKGRENPDLRLLAVTVLTSLDSADLLDLGFSCRVEELVLYRAKKACEYGCDGVVASGREVGLLRKELGNKLLVVTPGIRPAENNQNLHKRAVTPKEAVKSGADYLVVGRPITEAPDPLKAAEKIINEIARLS